MVPSNALSHEMGATVLSFYRWGNGNLSVIHQEPAREDAGRKGTLRPCWCGGKESSQYGNRYKVCSEGSFHGASCSCVLEHLPSIYESVCGVYLFQVYIHQNDGSACCRHTFITVFSVAFIIHRNQATKSD